MELFPLSLLVLLSVVGFIAIFFTTFGTLIIFMGAALFAFWTKFSIISIGALAFLFILYLIGEVLEYLLVVLGVKKLGSSNAAIIGALFGGVIGAGLGLLAFGINVVVGTFLGIFLGAFLVELWIHKDLKKSLKAGAGGIIGRLGSIVAKVIIAVAMLTIISAQILKSLEAKSLDIQKEIRKEIIYHNAIRI
ncbi:MAG: DUF456 domain-containing protein [Candidatus Omnitrophota bacterium]|nr:MAG: DUF456 domain-containing protein [Candidatus Omnitrophota bacterium]